jgi:ABC-type nitrate/sulfonate/bicarbonate transport system permease component
MASTTIATAAGAAGTGNQDIAPKANLSRRRAFYSVALGILLWEFVGRFVLTNGMLFAPFSEVLSAMWRLTASGEVWVHLYVSAMEFFLGFALATVAGIGIGVLMGRFAIVRDYADPWVSILYSSPLVALMPFYLLMFGVGLMSKVAIVFTVSIFPILLNTYVGIRSTDRNLLDVAQSFSCSSLQVFWKIEIPCALPFIIAGVRLGIGRGLTGVVVGELFSSQAGVGYLIATAGQSFDAATVLVGVLIFTICGYLMMSFLSWLTNYLAPWRASIDAR